mmetsp:Transcript_60410/g.144018  ORF Transcript_60410/g.144018 Transcript_60410/m.144018 type:complete len:223 (-) Transcript_60410:204-872(-)
MDRMGYISILAQVAWMLIQTVVGTKDEIVSRQAAGFADADLGGFLQQTFQNGLGVVLGVGDGDRALKLLRSWPLGVLFLVDPYIHLRRGYDRPQNLNDEDQQRWYERLRNILHDMPEVQGRYSFVREFSFAVPQVWRERNFGPDPVFIYVDANPSYAAVRLDLREWWPMLSAGGILAGSNYSTDGDGSVVGVSMAVDEFALEMGLPVFITYDEEPTWILQKN